MARFGLGLGAAGLVNLAIVLISDHFEGEQRTRWIGINAGVLTIALAAFPLVSGILTDLVGWRWALAPQSLGIVTALIAWRVLDGGRPPRDVDFRTQLRGAGHALRSRPIAISVIGAGLSFAVMFGVFLAALPTHLDADFGLSAWGRGVMMGLPAVSSSAVAFNLGRIRSRVSASIVTMVAASVWVVAFTVMGTAPVLWLLAIGSLTYGFGEGALIPTLQDAALSRAPGDQRAVVMAAWTASARAGQTVGPLAAAILLAGPGSSAAVLAGAAGALVLVALLVPRPFDR
jgi:MFS family permease